MHIGDIGHLGISSRKWNSHSTSSPHLSSAINSYSIVDLAITVCFEDFHEIVAPPNVNT